MMKRVSMSLIVALLPAMAWAQTPRAASTDVPVSKIVLFSSGVGYFEHAGLVHGNSATELHFRTAQINDILKSLLLQDQDGGHVGTITYPSQDPVAKTLKSFQVDITRNPSLADLLNQLRGAKVSVQLQGERLAGTILGVETRTRTANGELVQSPVLNLLTGASFRALELQAITSLSLDDPQLQEELTKALGALVQARDQDRKPVTINFNGTGDRRVRIGYVVETPVWKTSYRLALNEKGTGGWLQGWAIVENQTESDWNNVSLDLVSGHPISFTMDLYQPLYASRPNVVQASYANLRPQVYAGGIATGKEQVALDAAAAAAPAPGAPAQRRIGYDAQGRPTTVQLNEIVVTGTRPADQIAGSAMAASVASMAEARRLGTLTAFAVPNVTLARQKSAMLPIVTDSVPVERLSIYNAAALQSNPLNAVWFANRTGKSLLQGPVTVLDHGTYAGDAQIEDVPMGQDRYLSFGIDLDITMDNTKATNSGSVTTASINRGVMFITRKRIATRAYSADNKSDHDKTLLIEHPITRGWQLVDTQKPVETTDHVYRFKGVARANKVTTLTVNEEYLDTESMAILSADIETMLLYTRTSQIPSAVREALGKAVQMRRDVAALDGEINARIQQITDITSEQERIRENLKTIPQGGQYYSRLLAKLNEQESTIERLQGERLDLTTRRDARRHDLDVYLSTLTL